MSTCHSRHQGDSDYQTISTATHLSREYVASGEVAGDGGKSSVGLGVKRTNC